jgi:transposase InsO family protein
MDTCKIRPGLYQYTAIDDCSRWQVLGLYPRRTAANTRDFLEHVLEEMPFPVQRVQTDRGQEFFAYEVQDDLRERHIKFRPNRPRAPHLNGKVERVQRTALEEFWSTVDPKGPDLAARLEEWRTFYNHHRPHSALGGDASRAHRRAGARRSPASRPSGPPTTRTGSSSAPRTPATAGSQPHACHLINTDPTLAGPSDRRRGMPHGARRPIRSGQTSIRNSSAR